MAKAKTQPSRQSARDRADARRAQIAQFLKAGLTQREIATQVGVSLGTVNRDIQILRQRWWEEQLEDIEMAVLIDLGRIDDAIRAITNDVRSGDLASIDRLIRMIELRRDLLGYKWLHQAEIDWRVEAVHKIKEGVLDYLALEQELGRDLAAELFSQAGVPLDENAP